MIFYLLVDHINESDESDSRSTVGRGCFDLPLNSAALPALLHRRLPSKGSGELLEVPGPFEAAAVSKMAGCTASPASILDDAVSELCTTELE